MAEKGNDPVRNELIKLIRMPKNTFQNGILKTDNDNVNGFVSDLNNCEIDGLSVKARYGTKCLENPVVPRRWALFFSEMIAGSEILFGVTANGKIYAMNDRYPEKLFIVNKTGFTRFIYKDPDQIVTTPIQSHEAMFERGSVFWHIPGIDSFSIVNNYGDSFTITRSGSIQFMYESDKDHAINTAGRLRLCRTRAPYIAGVEQKFGLYIDIAYTRKQFARPFFFCDAPMNKYTAIRGNVKVAPVDDSGRLGELSQPQFLPMYKTKYVSMVKCLSGKDANLLSCTGYTYYGTGLFVHRTGADIFEMVSYYNPAPDDPFTRRDTRKATIMVVGEDPATMKFYMYFDALFFKERIAGGHMSLPEDDFAEDDFSVSLSAGNGIIRLDNLKAVEFNTASSTHIDDYYTEGTLVHQGINTVLRNTAMTVVPFTYKKTVEIITEGLTPHELTTYEPTPVGTDPVQAYTGVVYLLDISIQKKVEIYLSLVSQGLIKKYAIESMLNSTLKPSAFLTAEIKMKDTVDLTGAPSNNGLHEDWAPIAFSYELSNIFDEIGSSEVALLKNRGFDCWSVLFSEISTLEYHLHINVNDINIDDGTIQMFDSDYDVICAKSDYVDWLVYGSRFAVWNDGVVLGISQKVFYDEDYLPVYSVEDDRSVKQYDGALTGYVNNQIPAATGTINAGYIPVCALDFQTARKFGYAESGIAFGFNNPRDITVNGNLIFSAMGGSVAVGTLNDALSFFTYYNFNKDISNIAPLIDGIVVFAKDDIFFMGMDGQTRSVSGVDLVKNKNVKRVYAAENMVFGITMENEVIVLSTKLTANGDPYPNCDIISEAIKDVEWSADTDITFCNGTLYISNVNEIYGFTKGIWDRRYHFENKKIRKLGSYKNNLVISFDDDMIFRGRTVPVYIGGGFKG